jgi:hypothetical protein
MGTERRVFAGQNPHPERRRRYRPPYTSVDRVDMVDKFVESPGLLHDDLRRAVCTSIHQKQGMIIGSAQHGFGNAAQQEAFDAGKAAFAHDDGAILAG